MWEGGRRWIRRRRKEIGNESRGQCVQRWMRVECLTWLGSGNERSTSLNLYFHQYPDFPSSFISYSQFRSSTSTCISRPQVMNSLSGLTRDLQLRSGVYRQKHLGPLAYCASEIGTRLLRRVHPHRPDICLSTLWSSKHTYNINTR